MYPDGITPPGDGKETKRIDPWRIAPRERMVNEEVNHESRTSFVGFLTKVNDLCEKINIACVHRKV